MINGEPVNSESTTSKPFRIWWLFWNPKERRLRVFYRIALQAAMMVAAFFVVVKLFADPLSASHKQGSFLAELNKDSFDHLMNILVALSMIPAVLLSIAIAGRFLDHRRFIDFRARVDRQWWSSLALGLCVGGILMGLIFAFEYANGFIDVTGFGVRYDKATLVIILAFAVVKPLTVGIVEEFVSRGYHLTNLTEAFGKPAAVLLSSAVFGIIHLTNPNASLIGALGISVIGVMFAVAVIATGRLSAGIGLHISWNVFQGSIFGFPVSGDKEIASLVAIHQQGPDMLTGGAFGPEAGLLGIAAAILGIAIILAWTRLRKTSPSPGPA